MFIELFWNIFFKKKTTHVLRHDWFFSNFFSSFDIFQACSSDMHVFQACSSDMRGNFFCVKNQKLELPRVKWSSYSRFRFL